MNLKHRYFFLLAVTCALLLPGLTHAASYSFSFEGKSHSVTLDLAPSTIKHYENQTHYWPTDLSAYPRQANEDPGFEYLADVAASIKSQAAAYGYSGWDLVRFTTALVQNLTYRAETQEYVRYPIETLKDKGGDCEDTAILLAALINEMGYEAILVHVPGHMMTAIACSGCDGTTMEYKARTYVLVESTAPVGLGTIDNRFAGATFTGLELEKYDQGQAVVAVTNPQPRRNSGNTPTTLWGSDEPLPPNPAPRTSPGNSSANTVNIQNLPGFVDLSSIPGFEDLFQGGINGLLDFEGFQVAPGFVDMQNMPGWDHFQFDPGSFPGMDFDQFRMDPSSIMPDPQQWQQSGGSYQSTTTTTTGPNGTVTTTTVTTYRR